jgi:prophage antirepressor-like protein
MSKNRFRIFALDGHPVRGFIDEHGDPWIVAMDLAAPLELTPRRIRQSVPIVGQARARFAIAAELAGLLSLKRGSSKGKESFLLKAGKSGQRGAHTKRLMLFSESAVSLFVMRSNAALIPGTFAHRFTFWILDDVLPSLRRDGSYFVNGRAREIIASFPGWEEARAEGKQARREFTDIVRDFAAYAGAQGSNNPERYFKHFTDLANKCALGLASFPVPARDLLDQANLRRIALVEEALGELIDAIMREGLDYHESYAAIVARFTPAFVRARRDD